MSEISEISGGHQRFGPRQRFDYFEAWQAGTSSRYRTGESPPINAGHWGTIPHLESTCTRFNTLARRRTRPSAEPERSQQLQILLSLDSKAILQRVRLLLLLPNISVGAKDFGYAKVLASAKDFGCAKVLASTKDFGCAKVLASAKDSGCAKVLASVKDSGCAKVLASAKDFEGANVFVSAEFLYAPMFLYIFCSAYIFVYFSAFLI
jgi:hypothetical protein